MSDTEPSGTGLSEAAHELLAVKPINAVVEEAAATAAVGVSGSSSSASTDSLGNTSAQSTSSSGTSKTEQLARDLKDPINKMKGCGILLVLFACCVIVMASIFMQWRQGSIDTLQRQEMYEAIQILQHNQGSLESICNKMILQLNSMEETTESIEATVESVESTVEETRAIEIPLPLPIIE